MLSFDFLPNNSRETISKLIGENIENLAFNNLSTNDTIQLSESLKIIELPYQIESKKTGYPIFNGFWIHLIIDPEGYIGHAISTPTGGDETSWKLQGIFTGKIANHIATSLEHQKGNVNGIARFLFLPEHHGYAIVIYDEAIKYVTGLKLPYSVETIDEKKIYPWDDFMEIINNHPTIGEYLTSEASIAPPNNYAEEKSNYIYYILFISVILYILFN